MKRIAITFCAAALFCACNNNQEKTPEATQTDKPLVQSATTETPPDSATMMKNFMDYATPGKEQQMLASWDGNWTGEITMWMAPDAPPSKDTGSMTNKMILGGRYQQGTFRGNFEGMPFEGMSLTGFDNLKKVFVSSWIDNMGTGMMMTEGKWDEATRTITFTGKMMDPSIKKEINVKEIYRVVDDNTQVMEMYAPVHGSGKEFKTMEIKYTRKK